MVKKFLFPFSLILLLLSPMLAWAAPSTTMSYDEERSKYLNFLEGIVYEAKHSGIVTDVKLNDNKNKDQENKIEKLKKDLVKAVDILEKNKAKLKNYQLQNNKLVTTNEKIIISFEQSIKAMKGLHESIVKYDIIGFLKNFKALKDGDNLLREALQDIKAEYILDK